MTEEFNDLLGAADGGSAAVPPGASSPGEPAAPAKPKRRSSNRKSRTNTEKLSRYYGDQDEPIAPQARRALLETFELMGGVEGMHKWAKAKPEQFYKLFMTYGTRGGPVGRPLKKGGEGGAKVNIPGFTDGSDKG